MINIRVPQSAQLPSDWLTRLTTRQNQPQNQQQNQQQTTYTKTSDGSFKTNDGLELSFKYQYNSDEVQVTVLQNPNHISNENIQARLQSDINMCLQQTQAAGQGGNQ